MSEGIDIGHGTTIWIKTNEAGVDYALVEGHKDAQGQSCLGWCYFRGVPGNEQARSTWVVESRDPLTLSPSVLCTSCGHHGFIREGKWVPA